jgi:hypothetical protein
VKDGYIPVDSYSILNRKIVGYTKFKLYHNMRPTLYANLKICIVTIKLLGSKTDIFFDLAYVSKSGKEKYFITMKECTLLLISHVSSAVVSEINEH